MSTSCVYMIRGSSEAPKEYEELAEALQKAGFAVRSVTSGEDALQAFSETRPDLILLDLNIVDMRPRVFMERLREFDWAEKLPVICMIGGKTRGSDIDEVQTLEPSCVFIKSDWYLEHIVAKVKEVLDKK